MSTKICSCCNLSEDDTQGVCWRDLGTKAEWQLCNNCFNVTANLRKMGLCCTSTLGEKMSPPEDTASSTDQYSVVAVYLCQLTERLLPFIRGLPPQTRLLLASEFSKVLATLLRKG